MCPQPRGSRHRLGQVENAITTSSGSMWPARTTAPRACRSPSRPGQAAAPPTASGVALADAGHLAGGPIRFRHKAIHQRRLAHAGMAEEHRQPVGQQRPHGFQRVVPPGGDDRQVQVGELRGERFGRRQIRLRQAQNGFRPPA